MGAQTGEEGGEGRGEEREEGEGQGSEEEDVLTDFHRLIPPDRA
jgi:hypothetical protein